MDRTKIWELSMRVGGLFKLTVLLQKRIRELVNGAPKLVETRSEDYIEIALMEVDQGKIELEAISEEEIARELAAQGDETSPLPNPLGRNPLTDGDI